MKKKQSVDSLVSLIFRTISYITFFSIILIISIVIIDGARFFKPSFFFEYPKKAMTQGGIGPAILGSLIMIALILLISIPLGLLTGVFLSEYGSKSLIGKIIDIAVTSLSGVPSIVYGLFGLTLFSITLGFGTSILSGSLTLSIMTLPVIASSVREALVALPRELRESAFALGAKKTETIFKILIPAGKKRIITAILIGSGRVIGETAPVLLTGAVFYSTKLPTSLLDPVMTLPTHIYFITMSYGVEAQWMAKATSSFLLILILIIYLIAFQIRKEEKNV
ncbi:MAG: phosphate ABC transporter permease PstA [Defluviitoga tunisiensis]|jgi:phosphate transport system permease protein|uniref:Phosphate transport system permease protein PstA n=1 Tax=Defluviitoga tunisiensis TaxID=1006576 RepID=A0A0C7NLA7_DEFTU|nr:phosphate ABC transporter permease PstA [Defluviitoga tunisiensis]MDD3600135.1 phosphate ABC transporter permease PstA [Defluviitoga tunisiensis]MDY0379237.1 phosphate ABC transporter permease PstA [Defluviitoga tunisiensis]CEP78681.1 phosphate ABC transporter, inner membrane subunit [Defluviitoga tunisiensis]HHV01905.1 phosphate ABC transporter permease PstA [Defluviitoga tunisiensis]HOK15651.1 phosphate ABC transporter permease PstA [Defluviitoga tunisiensis]